ncbi:MAG: hypothetical protein NTU53_23835 [Planctomycetota bacterium]|nr:hypothetical protein [Planctomycetota bacterium]
MTIATAWNKRIILALLGCCLVPVARANESRLPLVKATDAASLKELEQRVRRAAERVLPAVVAVEAATKPDGLAKHSEPFGSGVIITADGLVLSQYHVTH